VAVVDVEPAKLEHAMRLGADLVINGALQAPKDALKSVGGASAAITFTGSRAAVEQAFPTLKPNGILVLVGLCTEPFSLPLLQTVLQGLRISGIMVGTPRDLQEIIDLGASGVPHVDVEVCALEDVPAVLERMRQGTLVGRAVVKF
jgi:alcohol dehydrogenase, propanol-preferring